MERKYRDRTFRPESWLYLLEATVHDPRYNDAETVFFGILPGFLGVISGYFKVTSGKFLPWKANGEYSYETRWA